MAGGGGKGGSQETKTEIKLPPWIEAEARRMVDATQEATAIGYTPYDQNTVAALAPQQIQAMRGVNEMASAYGMPSQRVGPNMTDDQLVQRLTGLAPPTQDANGNMGYSAMPNYEEARSRMNEPQRKLIDSFFIGENGASPVNPTSARLRYKPNRSYKENFQRKKNYMQAVAGGGGGGGGYGGYSYGEGPVQDFYNPHQPFNNRPVAGQVQVPVSPGSSSYVTVQAQPRRARR